MDVTQTTPTTLLSPFTSLVKSIFWDLTRTFTLLTMACFAWYLSRRNLFHPTNQIEMEDITEKILSALAKTNTGKNEFAGKP